MHLISLKAAFGGVCLKALSGPVHTGAYVLPQPSSFWGDGLPGVLGGLGEGQQLWEREQNSLLAAGTHALISLGLYTSAHGL